MCFYPYKMTFNCTNSCLTYFYVIYLDHQLDINSIMKYQKLTRAEEEIMQLIWQQSEPCTVSQLIDQMNVSPNPPHSTISTIVRTLEKKGFVDHKTYGRTHAYFPLIEKKEYTRFSFCLLYTSPSPRDA